MKSFCHWYSSHWVYVCYCCSFLPVACVSLIFPVHLGVVLCDNMMCDSSCSLFYSDGYGAFCRAVKMLFLEVVSVLCFDQSSYEPPTPELIEVLMNQIFKKEQVTQDLTPLPWEEPDSSPVVRSVLLQLILMGRCVDLQIPIHAYQVLLIFLNPLCLFKKCSFCKNKNADQCSSVHAVFATNLRSLPIEYWRYAPIK